MIVNGAGKPDAIKGRIESIKRQIENHFRLRQEKLEERLAKLSGGVAVIKVGAATETEMKEKKMRVEDALNATKAAVEEGIVPGGGVIFVNAIPELKKLVDTLTDDEKTGASIIMRALEEPLRQIAINAGVDGSIVVDKVMSSPKVTGFDVVKEEYVDMIKAGIIDPAKVTRSALQNAASIAAMILTTESTVTEKPEKKKEPPMPNPDYDY